MSTLARDSNRFTFFHDQEMHDVPTKVQNIIEKPF